MYCDHIFQSAKGVGQGDPLSPFIFNANVQCFAKIVFEALNNNFLVALVLS
jgi:hypothetical protein